MAKYKKTVSVLGSFKNIFQNSHQHIIQNEARLTWKMNPKSVKKLKKVNKYIDSEIMDHTWKCRLRNVEGILNLSLILLRLPSKISMKCEYDISFTVPVGDNTSYSSTKTHIFTSKTMHSRMVQIGKITDKFLTSLEQTEITVCIQIVTDKITKFKQLIDYESQIEHKRNEFETIRLNAAADSNVIFNAHRNISNDLPDHDRLNLVIEEMYLLRQRCDKLEETNRFLTEQSEHQQYLLDYYVDALQDRNVNQNKSIQSNNYGYDILCKAISGLKREIKSLKDMKRMTAAVRTKEITITHNRHKTKQSYIDLGIQSKTRTDDGVDGFVTSTEMTSGNTLYYEHLDNERELLGLDIDDHEINETLEISGENEEVPVPMVERHESIDLECSASAGNPDEDAVGNNDGDTGFMVQVPSQSGLGSMGNESDAEAFEARESCLDDGKSS